MSIRNIIYSAAGQSDLRNTRLQFSQTTQVSDFGAEIAISQDGNTLAVCETAGAGSVYVFTRSGSNWVEQVRLAPSELVTGDLFGYDGLALSSDGNTLAASASYDDLTSPVATNGGAVYIFTRSGTTWTQQARLQANDAANYDIFGSDVSLSSDGNTLAVGARSNDLTSPAITDAGSVYIFTRSGTTWTQQAQIQAGDPSSGDAFGDSVDLSADGNTLAVGATTDDLTSPAITDAGSVYIFTRSGTTWTQQARLQAAEASTQGDASLGLDIAISADGNTLAAGAYFADLNVGTQAGSVHVFTRSGTAWTQQVRLVASDAAAGDVFGMRVAISDNGNTIAVGAPYDDLTSPAAIDGGSVYVFTRSGTSWTQKYRLQSSNVAANHRFGDSVAINGDGSILAVGTEATGVSGTGAVYVYYPAVPALWSNSVELFANDSVANDQFGNAVAISSDGSTLAVGVPKDAVVSPATTASGCIYIFTRVGSTWAQQAKLMLSTVRSYDYFGYSVALSSDGNTLIAGSPYDDSVGMAELGGTAYVFTRTGTTWTQQAKLKASNAARYDNFGRSVSINGAGTTIAIGAPQNGGYHYSSIGKGKAYIFTGSGSSWAQQAQLTPADGHNNMMFGYSITLSNAGDTVAVGAPLTDNPSPAIASSGSAYTSTRTGTSWSTLRRITASDPAESDVFGHSVSLRNDGNTLVVGAPQYRIYSTGTTGSGKVYTYTSSGTVWTQQTKLVASDAVLGDLFGTAVAINTTGDTITIGAPAKSTSVGANIGVLYTFKYISGTWVQQSILNRQYYPGAYMGSSIGINSSANLVVAGARFTNTLGSVNIFYG